MKRRIVQIMSLLALNSSWGPEFKWLCTPVLNCHSCVLAWFACPIGVFVHYAGYHVFPYLALGMVLLLGVFLGRLLCGWVCPFGFLQDLLHKIPSPKFKLPHWTSYIKYVVLLGGVLLLPYLLGAESYYSFCRICPASALQVTLPSIFTDGMPSHSLATTVRIGFLAAVITLAIMSSRAFCKVICPIGAILAPLNYLSFWAIKVPAENCLACRKCDTACVMDGKPSGLMEKGESPNRQAECIVCHECQSACPQPDCPSKH